jgi:hypothetical protein
MYRTLGFASVLTLISFLGLVSAQCSYDTCLDGYVWRQAIPSDHVCVTPAVRSQAAADNAAAPTRINPSGPFGPNTCKNGFVWREAYTNDVVCVTPATRSEAAADNAAANSRVLNMKTWVTNKADGEQYDIVINGDGFNDGPIRVALFNSQGGILGNWNTITAAPAAGSVGGTWSAQFGLQDCSEGFFGQTYSGYALAQDLGAGCYTGKLSITYCPL